MAFRGQGGERALGLSLPRWTTWSAGRSRTITTLRLEDVGVFGARELFPLGDLHHIGIDLEPVAIGVQEIEGAAAATPKGVPRAAPPLGAMDEGPLQDRKSVV